MFIPSLCSAAGQFNRFSCIDANLKDERISIEKTQDSYSLFVSEAGKKVLVDQGLQCEFSNDGTKLFLCSNKPQGSQDLVQYFSESHSVDSMMSGSRRSTSFFRQEWESDIVRSKKQLVVIYGTAQTQCAGTDGH
jgi:hypothetical protein